MRDKFVIELAPGWALLFDARQWVLGRAEKKPLEGEKSLPGARVRGMAFIASTKTVLRRCLHENEIELTAEAADYIEAMPDTFKAWRRQYNRASTSTPGTIERAA